MNTRKIIQSFSIAAAISLSTIGFAAANNTGHTNKITCYASVHSECYGNGQNNCSEEDYNWGLDQCDAAYAEIDQGRLGNNSYQLDTGNGSNSRQRQ